MRVYESADLAALAGVGVTVGDDMRNETDIEQRLMVTALIASKPPGYCRAPDVAFYFGWRLEHTLDVLRDLVADGAIVSGPDGYGYCRRNTDG